MKKLLFVLLVLGLATAASPAEICITNTPNICVTTTTEENTAGLYYQTAYDDNLCTTVNLPSGCSLAEYTAAGGTETFYARTASGAKQFFMDMVIKEALTRFVSSYNVELDSRAKHIWNHELTSEQKSTTCVSWGKTSECKPIS